MTGADISPLSGRLTCPACRTPLVASVDALCCKPCGSVFHRDDHGYLAFTAGTQTATPDAGHAAAQVRNAPRLFAQYLRSWLQREPVQRVLDAGCGVGALVGCLLAHGYDAYGVDLPGLSGYWAQADHDRGRFFCCDAAALPFADRTFDAILVLGVIEHIGTRTGHCTLVADYQQTRQRCAAELLRVTAAGGRLLLACPNRYFPIDVQHGPTDEGSADTLINRLRNRIFRSCGLNLHPPWGRSHLLSYRDLGRLFCAHGGARAVRALPLPGYLGFSRCEAGVLRLLSPLARTYVKVLPAPLRATALNPYVLAEILK